VWTGMKCSDLEIPSTITRIESNLRAVKGKPTIKSVLMSSHFHYGILSGCNNPPGFI
jgi:hypothetical protein